MANSRRHIIFLALGLLVGCNKSPPAASQRVTLGPHDEAMSAKNYPDCQEPIKILAERRADGQFDLKSSCHAFRMADWEKFYWLCPMVEETERPEFIKGTFLFFFDGTCRADSINVNPPSQMTPVPVSAPRSTIVSYPEFYAMDLDVCQPNVHQVLVKHVDQMGRFVGPHLSMIRFSPLCGSGKTEDEMSRLFHEAKCPEFQDFPTQSKVGDALGYYLTEMGECTLTNRF